MNRRAFITTLSVAITAATVGVITPTPTTRDDFTFQVTQRMDMCWSYEIVGTAMIEGEYYHHVTLIEEVDFVHNEKLTMEAVYQEFKQAFANTRAEVARS